MANFLFNHIGKLLLSSVFQSALNPCCSVYVQENLNSFPSYIFSVTASNSLLKFKVYYFYFAALFLYFVYTLLRWTQLVLLHKIEEQSDLKVRAIVFCQE